MKKKDTFHSECHHPDPDDTTHIKYVITGKTTPIHGSKPFRIETRSFFYMRGINLYDGRKWEVNTRTGKRKLLCRVTP